MHPVGYYRVGLSVTQSGFITSQGIISAHISESCLLTPMGIKCLPGSRDV